jgi:hypothetical protein
MYGPDGWFDKHGLKGRPNGIPDSVEAQCKGQAIDVGRRMGKIPEKGKADISGKLGKSLKALPYIGGIFGAMESSQEKLCQTDPEYYTCTN